MCIFIFLVFCKYDNCSNYECYTFIKNETTQNEVYSVGYMVC